MHLIDRSPGAAIAVANTVLYSVVALESWMLTTASIAALILTMGVIIGVAALLCRWIMNLMGPEEHALDHQPTQRAAKVRAPAPPRRQVIAGAQPVAH